MLRNAILLLVFSCALLVDLDKLWQELGVGLENDAIVYDDAPLAHIRKVMFKSSL